MFQVKLPKFNSLDKKLKQKIQKMIIEGYRKISPLQKMQQVDEMTKAAQQMALARIRKEYKGCSKATACFFVVRSKQ